MSKGNPDLYLYGRPYTSFGQSGLLSQAILHIYNVLEQVYICYDIQRESVSITVYKELRPVFLVNQR